MEGQKHTQKICLPAVHLGQTSVRYLYYRRPNTVIANADLKEDGDILLYLAGDIFHGSPVPVKNHSRIHARFSKKGMASKLKFPGVTIKNTTCPGGAGLWFYSTHGVFTVMFEYQSTEFQRDAILKLQSAWLQEYDNPNAHVEADIAAQVWITTAMQTGETSDGGTGSSQEKLVFNVVTVKGADSNKTTYVLPSETSNDKYIIVHNDTSSSDTKESVWNEGRTSTCLTDIVNDIQDYIKESMNKVIDTDKDAVKKLKLYIDSYCVDEEHHFSSGLPCDILEKYVSYVQNKSLHRYYENVFGIPIRRNIILCLLCEWVGKQLYSLQDAVTRKVETFKRENISHIDTLPPPDCLVDQLFPQCMTILIANWMGKSDIYLFSDVSSSKHIDTDPGDTGAEVESDSSEPIRKRQCVEDVSPAKAAASQTNVFPFVQHILEICNNTLISGVAHVIYPRLLHSS